MRLPPRLLSFSLLALALAGGAAFAADTTPAPERKSPWEFTGMLRASAGWRENVMVSAFNPIDRAFWRAEAEAFVLRPLGQKWQVLSLLSGDVLWYDNPPADVAGEQQWIGHAEVRYRPASYLRLAVKGVGFLQETFVDPSVSEGQQLTPVWVRLKGRYATFTPRVSLPWGFTLEPSVQVKRIRYDQGYNGHFEEVRPGARLEWKRTDRLAVSVAWFEATRRYDELVQQNAYGWPERGLLRLHQREGEVRATTRFEARGQWTVSAAASRFENRDRAFGFLDYDQKRAQLEIRWARGAWRVSLTGDARRTDYLVQQVGAGRPEERPFRLADGYDAVLRIERDFARYWTVFVENRWERTRSNVEEFGARPFSYRTNMALAGLQRSF